MNLSDKELIRSLTLFRCDVISQGALQAEVTNEEIKREVFALLRNKSPGHDGFMGEFFKKVWDIVGDDFTKAVREFFISGQILRQWNSTAITLVPKKTEAVNLTDFRPISCCNVVYKVVSKILS